MSVIFVILIITLYLVITSGFVAEDRRGDQTDILPYLYKCKRDLKLPDLEKCVKRSIQSMQHYFSTGYGMNIPQCEPYYQPANFQFTKNDSTFTGNLSLFDIKIQGLTEYNIDNVRISPNFTKIQFDAHFPHLNLQAIYLMKAKILDLSISRGRHRLEAEIIKNKVNVIIEGKIKEEKSKLFIQNMKQLEHFEVLKVESDLSIGWLKFYFQRIDDSLELSRLLNEKLQKHWYDIESDMLAQIKPGVTALIRDIADGIYYHNSLNVLLPYSTTL